uniref:(northern house mosquito) hypothetical protein n=1 Tax=Culex pipiens TaxID=7175 RepID=A0A8D8NFG6_CULPI
MRRCASSKISHNGLLYLDFDDDHWLGVGRRAMRATARTTSLAAAVFRVTTRTMPSFPGCSFTIFPRGQLAGGTLSSLMMTTLPTSTATGGLQPFVARDCSCCRYSGYQRAQICWTRFCVSSQLFRRLSGISFRSISGTAWRLLPTRKCPGVRTSGSAGSSGMGVSGRELRHISICASSVSMSS